MRTRRWFVPLLAVAALVAPAALAETSSDYRRVSVGNARFGAATTCSVIAGHTGGAGDVSARTTLTARLAGRSFRTFSLARRVAGTGLGAAARFRPTTTLEVIGRTFTVEASVAHLSHTFSVGGFEVPVPVGPFVVTVEGSVGASVSTGGFGSASAGQVAVGLSAGGSVGGTVGVGVGIPGARVGVEGALNLVEVGLPLTATLRRSSLTLDVKLTVSSSVQIRAFAKVGVGPFSKKWTVDVPFLRFTVGWQTWPIASRTIWG